MMRYEYNCRTNEMNESHVIKSLSSFSMYVCTLSLSWFLVCYFSVCFSYHFQAFHLTDCLLILSFEIIIPLSALNKRTEEKEKQNKNVSLARKIKFMIWKNILLNRILQDIPIKMEKEEREGGQILLN